MTADSPFMKRLGDIVASHDAEMLAHMEPEAEVMRSLENPLNYNRRLKLIWAHTGMVAGPDVRTIGHADIRALMDRNPNLYTDISGVSPMSIAPYGGLRSPPITDDHRKLLPRFRSLLERLSDRVLFGLDTHRIE